MNHRVFWHQIRPLAASVAVLVSAVASIATSDCTSYEPLRFERHDSFSVGQTSRRYRVSAPKVHSISLKVDAGVTLRWVDPPAALTSDAGVYPIPVVTANSIEFSCGYASCDAGICGTPCDQFVIEVARSDAANSQAFTLTAESANTVSCEDDSDLFELKVVPE
jgi:hypothetical protein